MNQRRLAKSGSAPLSITSIACGVVFLITVCGATQASEITGKVKFEGDRPAREKLELSNYVGGRTRTILLDDVLLNAEDEVENVFVYVTDGLTSTYDRVSEPPAVLEQANFRYSPRVQGILFGQGIEFINSDPSSHNVHLRVGTDTLANFAQPPGQRTVVPIRRPASPIKVQNDVCAWMKAYVHVMRHPFFAVTDSQGRFSIKDLPAGEYTLAAWHEVFGTIEKTVVVGNDAPQNVTFTFVAPGANEKN